MPLVMLSHHPFTSDGLVLIESSVAPMLDRFRQTDARQPESGGILLGYRRGPHLHVVDVSLPQPQDRRSRFGFQRSAHPHQAIALERWKASHRTMDYLGEWHTHPEQHPAPSTLDLVEWKTIYGQRSAPMLFLIAGSTGENWIGIGCRSRLVRLAHIGDNPNGGAGMDSHPVERLDASG